MFEQISIFDFIENPKSKLFKFKHKIRLIELFGGVGAQSMGLRDLGADFEHYKLVEFDKYPVASYNSIHGTDFLPTDIRNISGKDLEIVDTDKYDYLLFYSFPCQDISVAGKTKGYSKQNQQNGNETRSGLLWEVERLLQECQALQLSDNRYGMPTVLIMENVPNVHGKANLKDWEEWLRVLEKFGYSSYWKDLNAADFGVPQSRKRTFCVSIYGEYSYEFPKPIPLTKVMKDYLEQSVDEKYYLTSAKAKELIDKLIKGGKILTDRQTVDMSTKRPSTLSISNCISARQDRGISNRKSEGTGVCEITWLRD